MDKVEQARAVLRKLLIEDLYEKLVLLMAKENLYLVSLEHSTDMLMGDLFCNFEMDYFRFAVLYEVGDEDDVEYFDINEMLEENGIGDVADLDIAKYMVENSVVKMYVGTTKEEFEAQFSH